MLNRNREASATEARCAICLCRSLSVEPSGPIRGARLQRMEHPWGEARENDASRLATTRRDHGGEEPFGWLLLQLKVDECGGRHGGKHLGQRGHTNGCKLESRHFAHTLRDLKESIQAFVVHDYRYPIAAKAHIEFHAVTLRRAQAECRKTVLGIRPIMCPAMGEKERAL